MMKWCCIAVLAVGAAGVSAQEELGSGQERVAFAKKAFPFEAEVAVNRLNVRMFPKGEWPGIVSSTLSIGDRIAVVGEKGDFYQIRPTGSCRLWVYGRNIRRDGGMGTVISGSAPVRLDSRITAEKTCELKEGDQVNIVGDYLGWYKIEAPASVPYFVSKKYVRAGGPIEEITSDKAGKPRAKAGSSDGDAQARARLSEAEAEVARQQEMIESMRLDDVNFNGVIRAYESAASLATSPALKAQAEKSAARYRELQMIWFPIQAQKIAKDREIERMKREAAAREDEVPETSPYTAMGYVNTTGALWRRPGTHKLMMGGDIVTFLRIREGDAAMTRQMNNLYGEYVGVKGVVVEDPEGWEGHTVIVVEEIERISE